MANQLKMAVVQAILTLKELGRSQRRADRPGTGNHRETVARHQGGGTARSVSLEPRQPIVWRHESSRFPCHPDCAILSIASGEPGRRPWGWTGCM